MSLRINDLAPDFTVVKHTGGDDVIIAGSVSDDDAKKLFPDGGTAPKPYLRVVKQPG